VLADRVVHPAVVHPDQSTAEVRAQRRRDRLEHECNRMGIRNLYRDDPPGQFVVNVNADGAGGRVTASLVLNGSLCLRLPEFGDTRYPMLSFLDDYGDTVFNELQMKQLLAELHHLRGEISLLPALECLDALVALIRSALKAPHNMLTFVGD
jgi:hypothetical protein